MYKAVLFDLDGTLLPMDLKEFTDGYFSLLTRKAAPYGYDPASLVKGVWAGTRAMVENDGSMTNFERFWKTFAGLFGERAYMHMPVFDDFYRNEFDGARVYTQPDPARAARAVDAARRNGRRVLLATNPVFPESAVRMRLGWIGLDPRDFDYISTYENSRYCKPSRLYYSEILKKANLDPRDCLMVGNDVAEDAVPALDVGLDAYLVTDCLINASSAPVPAQTGTFDELTDYLQNA